MMCISYKIGGGGGGGSGLDYVILLITVDYGGREGGKKCQKLDYVICERPLIQVKLISTFEIPPHWFLTGSSTLVPDWFLHIGF